MDKIIDVLTTISTDLTGVRRARIAAAVVYKNRVISIGVNQMKSHPFQAKFAKNEHAIYFHAETAAIYAALRKLSEAELAKSTLVVVRTRESPANGEIVYGIAKPCEGCEKCIKHYNIKTVVYSMDCETSAEHSFVYKKVVKK